MWSNKDKPGYPENPETQGWHFIDAHPRWWDGVFWDWHNNTLSPESVASKGFVYNGPCYSQKDLIDACKKQRITTAQDMVDTLDELINNLSLKLEAMNTMSETFKMAIEKLKDGVDEQE
jgi:hypothetical protein